MDRYGGCLNEDLAAEESIYNPTEDKAELIPKANSNTV